MQLCPHTHKNKETHRACFTQTHSRSSNLGNRLLNPRFPTAPQTKYGPFRTNQAGHQFYTDKSEHLNNASYIFRRQSFFIKNPVFQIIIEMDPKGRCNSYAFLFFFFVRALFASSCFKQFSKFPRTMFILQIRFRRCVRKKKVTSFFAVTH